MSSPATETVTVPADRAAGRTFGASETSRNGEEALERMATERPSEFCKVAASLIPKDFHIQQSMVEQPGISIVIDPASNLAGTLRTAGHDVPLPDDKTLDVVSTTGSV